MEQFVYPLLIALSLALDAFAVSVSSGISIPGFGVRQAVRMGLWFGAFQLAMPLLGWRLGTGVSAYIAAVDHWIAFGLLAAVGGKMAAEALKKSCEAEKAPVRTELTPHRLALLGLATSIDALAVGVSMAFTDVEILSTAAVIGAVAFALSVLGGLLGRRLGCRFQKRAELAGGAVLILVGLNILMEHLYGG